MIFTNISGPLLTQAQEFCQKFKFEFLEDEPRNVPNIEWLVYQGLPPAPGTPSGTGPQMPRSYRTAFAMVKGNPIIRKEWIEHSLNKGKLQDYEEYKTKYHSGCRKGIY